MENAKTDKNSQTVHGGKRTGAGRPKLQDPQKSRPVKVNNANWSVVEDLAKLENLSFGDLFVKLAKEKKEKKEA